MNISSEKNSASFFRDIWFYFWRGLCHRCGNVHASSSLIWKPVYENDDERIRGLKHQSSGISAVKWLWLYSHYLHWDSDWTELFSNKRPISTGFVECRMHPRLVVWSLRITVSITVCSEVNSGRDSHPLLLQTAGQQVSIMELVLEFLWYYTI